MRAVQQQHQEIIAQVGFTQFYVFDPQGRDPSFVYTAGFHSTLQPPHPELIAFSLPPETALDTWWAIYELAQQGQRVEPNGQDNNEIASIPVRFLTVTQRWKEKLFGQARGVHGHWDFAALQLVYPDAQGRWPWEQGYDFLPQTLLNTDTEAA